MIELAAVFAVAGAASNAVGTAFQRKAASLSSTGGIRLLAELVRRPVWMIGMAGVICAALFQSLALVNGPLALVQPLFILELPFALLIAAPLMHRRLPPWGWWGVGGCVAGLAVLLVAAAPHGATSQAPLARWIPALCLCVGAMAAAVLLASRGGPPARRAALLAAASATGNALTAALLKSASGTFADEGFSAFLRSWQTYGFALAGVASVLLLENALQAGPLAAAQPALTIGDAVVSLALGVTLFDERIRTGWWLVPEACGALLIVGGVLVLSRAVQRIIVLPAPVEQQHSTT
ncbi:DMT family transporter [Streptomyces cyanogenus]|uniref:4-amino-4-deoxy-L-arabinose-phosphoundecaprenol flippase subunit ArnE n=1 Tax=Streptomyces cyanogenus TaxID=80860 RepID=A0ABX7U1D8_STRCY|nr:DMT family transporter [Streptomyces cyanogenus]QTE02846.1 4-amino-4-deoxy-L-arabinose-phosphoundecaprenol flippase subunit ArnE [Streptomyces cyanogenus]